jgi:DNA-binding MarR family transcriptional regulator
MNNSSNLRFNGSLWCNLDIALRNIDQIYSQSIESLGLTVIEWYILRALYEQDGQHASELARAVGRAATSFTPILDKLQHKDMIQRRPDPADRRAVRIYLTDTAQEYRQRVMEAADRIEKDIHGRINNGDYSTFKSVLSTLQDMSQDQAED